MGGRLGGGGGGGCRDPALFSRAAFERENMLRDRTGDPLP